MSSTLGFFNAVNDAVNNPHTGAKNGSSLRVAYLVNIYPQTSVSFIRRELVSVEAQGVTVLRHTLRRWDGTLVDPHDLAECQKTRAVLEVGAVGLLRALLATALARPRSFIRALKLAIWFGQRAGSSGQGVLRHLIYLAEACVLLGWSREEKVDHVHAHFGTNSTVAALLCRELGGPPFSFTAHGPEEFDKPLGLGLDEKIRRAAFGVAISEHGRSQLCRWVPYEEWSKIQVIRCGLDSMFLNAESVPLPTARRLICVGRLAEQKGHLTLIEAARRLRADKIDFELILVGDGALRGEIERLITRYDLEDQVHLVGWQSNAAVRDLISGCRAMIQPSFAEGLPVVIMEALALGRPVISTYVGGIPELVQHGITGWLVPASSVEPLCAAICEALDAPLEQLERMGRAGAARVAQQHNAAIEAGKLVELFRRGAVCCSNVLARIGQSPGLMQGIDRFQDGQRLVQRHE
jgi:colanic acid/amylovoran biosynthesis glycosyltransferase